MLTRQRARGFSLVELMVAVIALAILTAMAVPNFTTWIRNSRVRSVADALQSGVRLAQAEAQRRTRTVVFFMTTSKDCSTAATASASGSYWQIRTVPNALMTDDSGTADSAEAVQCGALADVSSGVNINASADEDTVVAALCFSADGRQTSVTRPAGIGVDCTASSIRFDVASDRSGGDNRPLRVTVGLGGNVRMCDPGKSSNASDGCRS